HDVCQQPEDALEVGAVRLDQPVGEQVQPEVDVIGVDRGGRQVGDAGVDGHRLHAAGLVGADEFAQLGRGVLGVEDDGLGGLDAVELGLGEPDVEHDPGVRAPVGHGCDACCVCASSCHETSV